jgi:hypothetical protein
LSFLWNVCVTNNDLLIASEVHIIEREDLIDLDFRRRVQVRLEVSLKWTNDLGALSRATCRLEWCTLSHVNVNLEFPLAPKVQDGSVNSVQFWNPRDFQQSDLQVIAKHGRRPFSQADESPVSVGDASHNEWLWPNARRIVHIMMLSMVDENKGECALGW